MTDFPEKRTGVKMATKKQHTYEELIRSNREWVDIKLGEDSGYFRELQKSQKPPFLYIGCSDSRMPLDTFTQSNPGEMFVHRNIANQVSFTDMNLLTVLEFAIQKLKVEHIIVCGHTGCGGIEAAYRNNADGLIVNWVQPIKEIIADNRKMLDAISDIHQRLDRISELNIIHQVENLLRTSVIEKAFKLRQKFFLHGWLLEVGKGNIKEIVLPVDAWKKRGLMPKSYKFRKVK